MRRDRLSVVVTRGLSDWSRSPAPPPDATVLAGPMCAVPEGPGFTARFER